MVDLSNRSSGDAMSELTVEEWVRTNKLASDNTEAATGKAGPADDMGAAAGPAADGAAVAAVRGFNRFYTNALGLLRGKYLDTPYSLTEARLLFELAQRDASEVTDLRRTVDIDPGYLSRILARFESDGVIARQRSAADGRRQVIQLTGSGREVVAGLDTRSAEQVRDMLAALCDDDRRRLLDEVLRFARRAGYSRITLWTNDVLADARRIYQRAGFTLDDESRHHSFGKDLTGQNWSRDL